MKYALALFPAHPLTASVLAASAPDASVPAPPASPHHSSDSTNLTSQSATQNNASDVINGPLIETEFFFHPVGLEWRKMVVKLFDPSFRIKSTIYEKQQSIPLRNTRPTQIQNVQGDGACLFRCFSVAIWGNEQHHKKVRNVLMNFMEADPLRDDLGDLNSHLSNYVRRMRQAKTWGTEREIMAFAELTSTPVHVYSKFGSTYKWQRFPSGYGTDEPSVYLINFPSNMHYMFVIKP
jgi:hypothetical protein